MNQHRPHFSQNELYTMDSLRDEIQQVALDTLEVLAKVGDVPGVTVKEWVPTTEEIALHTLVGQEWEIENPTAGLNIPAPRYSLTTAGKIVSYRKGEENSADDSIHDVHELDTFRVGPVILKKHLDAINQQYKDAKREIRHRRVTKTGAFFRNMGNKIIGK